MTELETVHLDTSHWLVSEEPEKANAALLDFISRKIIKSSA
jgi:hypothetical protein